MRAEVKVWDIWFTVDVEVDSNDGVDLHIETVKYDEKAAEDNEGFFRSDFESKAFQEELKSAVWDYFIASKDED